MTTSYWYKIKANPELLEKERTRVLNILNEKYRNNPEYREQRKEYQKNYRLKKKMTVVKTI